MTCPECGRPIPNIEIYNFISIITFLFISLLMSSIGIIYSIGGDVLKLDLGDILTAIATLTGAAGGALISGRNAIKLWNTQEEKKRKSKEELFNAVLYAEIKRFELDYYDLLEDLTEAEVEKVFDNTLEYKELLLQMYSTHSNSIEEAVRIFSDAYLEVKNLINSGIIDEKMYAKMATINIKIKPLTQLKSLTSKEKEEKVNLKYELTKEQIIKLEILTGLNLGRNLIIDLYNYLNKK